MLVLQADKAELCCAPGVAGGAMFAVCDDGFAAALQKKLQAETDPVRRLQIIMNKPIVGKPRRRKKRR